MRDAALDEERSFEAALAYGGTISFPISESWRFELLYSRQPTKLEGGLAPAFDVTIERYLAGFQEEKGEGGTSAGSAPSGSAPRASCPDPGGFDAVTKFGAGVGLGVKTFLAKNVGLRFEARGFYTLVKGDGGSLCLNGELPRSSSPGRGSGRAT